MHSATNTLAGQTALITGAGIGIGFAIAKALVYQGVNVLINDLDPYLTNQAAEAINQATGNQPVPPTSGAAINRRGRCVACPGDASDVGFVQQLVETAAKTFGSLDIAIANAGITIFGDIFTTTPDAFETIVNLNLRGSFFLAQAAARHMRDQQTGGTILFMSSVVGQRAHPGLPVYSMTKAGLEMLAQQLVIDLSPLGISVNAVVPGATLTERTLDDPAYIPTWSRITPMGRPATVDDIANAALFLVSPASRHITGQRLVVDGGWTCVGIPPVS